MPNLGTWTVSASAVGASVFQANYMAYDGTGLLLAVRQDVGAYPDVPIYESADDGVTWTAGVGVVGVSSTFTPYAFAFQDGQFSLYEDTDTRYYTSPDNVTWTLQTAPAAVQFPQVTAINGILVAKFSTSTADVHHSLDGGLTWEAGVGALPSTGAWRAITFGASTYLTVKYASTAGATCATPDGTWASFTLPVTKDWLKPVYGNGVFVVAATDNGAYYSSDVGATWTACTFPGTMAPNFNDIRFLSECTLPMFLATVYDTDDLAYKVISSVDGIIWVLENATGLPTADYRPIEATNTNVIITAFDDAAYTAVLIPVIYNDDLLATANATEAFEALITAFFLATAQGTDAMATQDIMNLRAVANATIDQVVAGRLFSALMDFVDARDDLRQLIYGVLTAGADASEALDSFYQQIELLRARAHAVDPLLSSQTIELVLLATATTLDMIASGYDADLVDAANATYTLAAALQANASLLAEALAAEAMADSAIFSAALAADAEVDDTLDAAAQLNAFLEAGGEASVYLRLAGEDYTAWVLNLDNIAVTEYRNYEFNSFADFNGTYYGAADDGLYTLGGDTDAGAAIPAWIRTGLSNYGSGLVKRMPMMYVGYTAANGLVLKVAVTDKGVKTEHWFRLEARTADATRADRAKIGKGLAAVYWQWELHNIDGGDFDIDTLRLWPMVLTRRVR